MSAERAAPFVEAAWQYAELGWALTRANGKKAKGLGWEQTKPEAPEHTGGKWSHWGQRWNLGVVLGPSGLAVLDVDHDDADAAAAALLGELPVTPTVRTGRGRLQVYYRDPGGLKKRARDGFELRVGPHMCIAPPSEHPDTGRAYVWLPGRAPWKVELAELPPALVDYFAAEDGRGAREPIPETIPPGGRHEALLRVAGAMRRQGADYTEIRSALVAMNEARCTPPKPLEEVEELALDVVSRYAPAPPAPPIEQKAREAAEKRQAEEAAAEEETAEVADEVATVTDEPDAPDAPAWQPLPLPQAAAKAAASPRPEHGLGLVYGGGNITLLSAEPGIGKSMLSAIFTAEEARAGRTVLYLDFERTALMLDERLIGMGLTEEERNRVHYLRPQEPATAAEIRAMLADLEPSLVVVDAYDAALAAFGFETKNEDVRKFNRAVLEPLRSSAAAVLVPDHVTKNPGQRGRYSIGGQSKLAIVEAHIGVTAIAPLRRETGGKLKLHNLKDSHGWLPTGGMLDVRVDNGVMAWTLKLDSEPGADPGPFRPTALMERVSCYIEELPEPPSRKQIEDEVKGKRDYVRLAIDTLIEEGYAVEKTGARNARLVVPLLPFREDGEEGENDAF